VLVVVFFVALFSVPVSVFFSALLFAFFSAFFSPAGPGVSGASPARPGA